MSRIAREFPDQPEMWDAPPQVIPAFPGRCRCSHPESTHGTDRRGRYQCFFAVCACTRFRPDDVKAAMDRHPAGKANTDRSEQ